MTDSFVEILTNDPKLGETLRQSGWKLNGMTDDPQFPQYPKAPSNATTRFAHPSHAKIMLKLMGRALQGKRKGNLWKQGKRKKVRVV